jgi:hypothetical protein
MLPEEQADNDVYPARHGEQGEDEEAHLVRI